MDRQFNKEYAFYYLQFRVLEWYKELNCKNNIDENDFSILKSMKILFFVASVNCEQNNSLLETTFNRFVAMPYGHVEKDVYEAIRLQNCNDVIINTRKTIFKNEFFQHNHKIDESVKLKIDESIRTLRLLNNFFVNYTAFELVELSHKWNSWNVNFSKAIKKGSRVESIHINDIKNDHKLFVL